MNPQIVIALLLPLLYNVPFISAGLSATCNLQVVGTVGQQKVNKATFSCRGAEILVAADERLSQFTPSFVGLRFTSDNCGWQPGQCLLAICGNSTATLMAANVTAVIETAGLCISGNASVTLQQASLRNNIGASAVWVKDAAQLQLLDSVVKGNQGPVAGAGLRATGNSKVLVQHTQFVGNAVDDRGGAVVVTDQAVLNSHGCVFHNNTAGLGPSEHSTGYGGALYLGGSAVVGITATNFTANAALGDNGGGAIAAGGNSTLAVTSSRFEDNTASDQYGQGGALHVTGSTRLTITDSIFTGNKCKGTGGGGAVYAFDNTQVTISGSSGFHNGVSEHGNSAGGGLAVGGSSVVMFINHNITFHNNSAGWGGAIGLYDSASVYDSGPGLIAMLHNYAFYGGGALYAHANASFRFTSGSSCVNNAAGFGGCAHVENSAVLVLEDALVQGNVAEADHAGGISAITDTMVVLSYCSVIGNTALIQGGASRVAASANATIRSTTIAGNQADTGCGGVAAEGTAVVSLDDVVVANNTAGAYGGGLCSKDDATFVLQHTNITHNVADNGGGLFVTDAPTMVLLGAESNVKVYNNSAFTSGGGWYLNSSNLNLTELQSAAFNNSAKYNNELGSMPLHLELSAGSNATTCVAGFVSRLSSKEGLLPVELKLTGYYGLPVAGDVIQARLDGSLMGENTTAGDGSVLLKLKILKPPGTYVLIFTDATHPSVPMANLTVCVTNCSVGDITTSSGDACMTCTEGWYSFNPANTTCDRCPNNAVCPGGYRVKAAGGYWHSSPWSVQMHRCLDPASCPGNSSSAQQTSTSSQLPSGIGMSVLPGLPLPDNGAALKDLQCAEGFEGNLCGNCAPGYGGLGPITCSKCMAPAAVMTLFVTAAVTIMGMIKIVCHFTRADGAIQASTPVNEAAAAAAGGSTREAVRPTDLIKPLITYLQYALIVGSMNVYWPAVLSAPFTALAWLWSSTSSQTMSIACLLPRNTSVPVANQQLLLGVCLPLAMFVVLMCIELVHIAVCLSKQKALRVASSNASGQLASLAIVVCFFFLPLVVRTVLGVFSCVPLDKQVDLPYVATAVGSFWQQDMSQQCFTGYHAKWAYGLGVPLVLAVCFAWPTFIAAFTLMHKSALQDKHFQQHYGFLVRSYKPQHCYWEAVVAWQTCVLVAISVFGVTLGPYYQSLIMSAWLTIVMLALLVVQPHASAFVCRMHVQSIGCLLLASYAAQSFLPHGDLIPNTIAANITGTIVLVVNVACVCYLVWKIVMVLDWNKMQHAVQTVVRQASKLLLQRLPSGAIGGSRTDGSGCSGLLAQFVHSRVGLGPEPAPAGMMELPQLDRGMDLEKDAAIP